MENPKKKVPGRGKFDSLNSTFKQIIYLTSGRELTGYSKGAYLTESRDKIYVLISFIRRMYGNGYFHPLKTKKIEYYQFNEDSQTYSDMILILTPSTYHFSNDLPIINDSRFLPWLKKFYGMIKAGKVDFSQIMVKPERTKEADIFSLDTRRFENDTHLVNFCNMLYKGGYEQGRINDFYIKYRDKFFVKATPSTPTDTELKKLSNHFNANR